MEPQPVKSLPPLSSKLPPRTRVAPVPPFYRHQTVCSSRLSSKDCGGYDKRQTADLTGAELVQTGSGGRSYHLRALHNQCRNSVKGSHSRS
ncbi:unnamed protein product [Nezara viridula]|uniref:Uncharacterized protein n=1 Tax=Nezara viridula TaxID=85310 RepID=A0A9P0HH64_NEZVI|nr:unnamed protein product [Nezara viridula]